MTAINFLKSQRFKTYVQMVVCDLDDSVAAVSENSEALADIEEYMLEGATDVEEYFMQPFVKERLLNLLTCGLYVSNFEYWLRVCEHGKIH